MYICQVCQNCSEPGESMQVHRIYRQVPYTPSPNKMNGVQSVTRPVRSEIAKEIPVCNECAILLIGGIPLHMLLRQRGQPKRMGTCEPIDNRAQDVARKMTKKIVKEYGEVNRQENINQAIKEMDRLYNSRNPKPISLTPEQRKQAAIDKFKAQLAKEASTKEIANKTTK